MKIKIIAICNNTDELVDYLPIVVTCTEEELESGVIYDAVEQEAEQQGYIGPFAIIKEDDKIYPIIDQNQIDWKDATKLDLTVV